MSVARIQGSARPVVPPPRSGASCPTPPAGRNGRPAQVVVGAMPVRLFDHRTGRTVSATLPVFRDDHFRPDGYFSVDRHGMRHDLAGWSPAAALGNARDLAARLLERGELPPANVRAVQTHTRTLGGDGAAHWIPTARTTYRDGQALFWAHRAARIPTDTVPASAHPEFGRGFRDARNDARVLTGMAAAEYAMTLAGIGALRTQIDRSYTLVDAASGHGVRYSWTRGNGPNDPVSRIVAAGVRADGSVAGSVLLRPPAQVRPQQAGPGSAPPRSSNPAGTGPARSRPEPAGVAADRPARPPAPPNAWPQRALVPRAQTAPPDLAARIAASTLAGTGASPALREQFAQRLLSLARADGDAAATTRRLQALADPSAGAERARLLVPLLARHLGGGQDALTRVLTQRLTGHGESDLRRLLEHTDGRPSPPQINALRGAMVRLIAAEARLGVPAQRLLDSDLIEHLRGRPATEQRRWLVDLAGSPSTRRRLADAASPRDPSRGAPTSHPIPASSAPRREPGVRWSDEVERLYDGIAPAWNAIVSRPRIDPIRDAEARQLLDALQLREGDRVANIGIGAGDFESRTGAPKRVGDAAWLGIDVSGAMLREAAQRHPGIELLKADFLDLPQGLTFDKCVAHHVLCHVRDLDGALQAIFERLPEGGLFTFIERGGSHHDLDGLVLDRRYPTIPESALRESMSRLEFERTSVEFLDAIQRGNWGRVRSRPVTLDSLQTILVK